MSEISPDQVLDLIRSTMNDFSYEHVYFKLKQYRIKKLMPATVEITRCCLAIHQVGLPITTHLVAMLMKKDPALIQILHALGDKHVLILKRSAYAPEGTHLTNLGTLLKHAMLEWLVNPAFLKLFET